MASEVSTSWQRLVRELNYTLTEYTFVSAFRFFGGCFVFPELPAEFPFSFIPSCFVWYMATNSCTLFDSVRWCISKACQIDSAYSISSASHFGWILIAEV